MAQKGYQGYLAEGINELWLKGQWGQHELRSRELLQGQSRNVPIFVTGTGTDVGKTYVTAVLCKCLQEKQQLLQGGAVGFYKAAISGAESLAQSDAGYIKRNAGLSQADETLTSYLFQEAVSPHLAAQHLGQKIDLQQVISDLLRVFAAYNQLVIEGSGGIFCPLCWDLQHCPHTARDTVAVLAGEQGAGQAGQARQSKQPAESDSALLERLAAFSQPQAECATILDLIRALHDSVLGVRVVVVADAGLGVINNVATTVQSLQLHRIKPQCMSVILNRYQADDLMHQDNLRMIESITHVPVIATIASDSSTLSFTSEAEARLQCLWS